MSSANKPGADGSHLCPVPSCISSDQMVESNGVNKDSHLCQVTRAAFDFDGIHEDGGLRRSVGPPVSSVGSQVGPSGLDST